MPATRPALLLAAMLVLGTVAPVVAAGSGSFQVPADASALTASQTPPGNDTAVRVKPGPQLATVLAATEVTTRSEIETVRFERELGRGDDAERAEALADRAESLAERAEAIRATYEAATAAREAGDLSDQEYAQRLAELNVRAEQLLEDVEMLRAHARNVSRFELEAAGLNRTALQSAVEAIEPVTGVGPTALLQRFLGESTGSVELRTADGLRLEVEGEDGETSLEVRRPRDDDDAITVAQDAALRTARAALPPGEWILGKASVHPDDGYYKFEFGRQTHNATGEAEVRVDGSSGDVFRLEVENERVDDDDAEDDDEHDGDDGDADRELSLLLVGGTPAPNATVTVRALADGEPAANVTIAVNDHPVARTDPHGEATIRLPELAEVEVTAGDDGELEFEFDEAAHERRALFHQLDADAVLTDGTVTVRVRYDGSPVRGVAVEANDRHIGRTGADGTVTFAFDTDEEDELELALEKGEFEAEFEYDVRHGDLVLTESEQEGADDHDADGDDDSDADEDDSDDSDDDTEEDDEGDDVDDSSGSGSGDDDDAAGDDDS